MLLSLKTQVQISKSGRFGFSLIQGTPICALALSLCLALILSCSSAQVQWEEQGTPELVARVNAPISETLGLSGQVRVESKVGEQIRKGRLYFALKAPKSLLLEAVSPSDDTIATLVMNGEHFVVFELLTV